MNINPFKVKKCSWCLLAQYYGVFKRSKKEVYLVPIYPKYCPECGKKLQNAKRG